MSYELFLKQDKQLKYAFELRNAFTNNMSTDAKLNKTQISKIIQSSGSFGSWLVNLASNVKTNFERQIS